MLERRYEGLPLRVELPDGHAIALRHKPLVTLRINRPSAVAGLLYPSLARLAKAYVDGRIDVVGSMRDAVRLGEEMSRLTGRTSQTRWRPRRHGRRSDARAIAFHYDVSNDFYRVWLDRNMVYSCAYFPTGREDIHEAQERKLDHVCRKLMLQPGDRFLDVGCGWGALAIWAARHYGARTTGITLSRAQYEYSCRRVREEGLEGRCRILLCDYRDFRQERPFDKISSIGMFEHVGLRELPAYFGRLSELLRDGGLLLNHGICTARLDAACAGGNDGGKFIDRYVFPGGELAHASRVARDLAGGGFELLDVESLRPHYAQTLAHWLTRLEGGRRVLEAVAGERLYRVFRAYLAGAGLGFERGWISVYQMLATKGVPAGHWPLPWTRRHVYS